MGRASPAPRTSSAPRMGHEAVAPSGARQRASGAFRVRAGLASGALLGAHHRARAATDHRLPAHLSPSTKGTIAGDVVRVDIRSEADFAKYKGQLKDKIVLPQAARRVRMLEDRIILRMNEQDIAEALTTPIPATTAARVRRWPRGWRGRHSPSASRSSTSAEGVAGLLERGSDSDLSAGGSDLVWLTQRVDGGTIFPGGGGSRNPKAPTAGAFGDDCRRALQPHDSRARKGSAGSRRAEHPDDVLSRRRGDTERHQHRWPRFPAPISPMKSSSWARTSTPRRAPLAPPTTPRDQRR